MDLGGAAGVRLPPPTGSYSFVLHTFLPKSAHVGGWRPPPTGDHGSATVKCGVTLLCNARKELIFRSTRELSLL